MDDNEMAFIRKYAGYLGSLIYSQGHASTEVHEFMTEMSGDLDAPTLRKAGVAELDRRLIAEAKQYHNQRSRVANTSKRDRVR